MLLYVCITLFLHRMYLPLYTHTTAQLESDQTRDFSVENKEIFVLVKCGLRYTNPAHLSLKNNRRQVLKSSGMALVWVLQDRAHSSSPPGDREHSFPPRHIPGMFPADRARLTLYYRASSWFRTVVLNSV